MPEDAGEVTVFGIPGCDQVRRARAWLRAHRVAHGFHDLRTDGLPREALTRWLRHLPWDALLNRRGTTWRMLSEARRVAVVDQASAVEAIRAEPMLLKRPVVEAGDRLLVGFSEAAFEGAFGAAGDPPSV